MRRFFTTVFSTMALATYICASSVPMQIFPSRMPVSHHGRQTNVQAIKHRQTPVRHADESTPEVILDTPQGEQKMYTRSGFGFTNFFGEVMVQPQEGMSVNIVYAPDGKTVYIQDPVAYCGAGSWVKGELNNNEIVVPAGQYVYYDTDYGLGYKVGAGKLSTIDQDGQEMNTYVYDESITNITYKVSDDGTISLEDRFTFDMNSDDDAPQYILGCFYTDNGDWAGYGDWNSVYTLFTDEIAVFPDDCEIQNFVFKCIDEYNENHTTLVKCAVKDNLIYIKGFSAELPEGVIIGEINGDKVTFKSNQYLGMYNNAFLVYFVPATYRIDMIYDAYYDQEMPQITLRSMKEISLSYDNTTKTMTSPEGTCFIANAMKEDGSDTGSDINYVNLYLEAELESFTEVAATPADPEIREYKQDFETQGYNLLRMTVPTTDINGKFINPEKMSYIIYIRVDGEEQPYTFYSDEYVGLTEHGLDEITELPYNFICYDAYGWEDIMGGGEEIYFYSAAPDAIGVQSFYEGAGERRASNTVWHQISEDSAVESTNADEVPAMIFGIDGLRRNNLEKGVNIVRMDNGSTRKVIVK